MNRSHLREVKAGLTANDNGGNIVKMGLAEFDSRIIRGILGGIFAGAIFLLATMWYADSQDLPAVAPMLDISTIFFFADMPVESPENVSVGIVVHTVLTMLFGITFALLVVPFLTSARALVLGGLGFGIALYLFNFQVLGRLFFEWFQEGPNQMFELFIHAVYGLLLVPFFLSDVLTRRSEG